MYINEFQCIVQSLFMKKASSARTFQTRLSDCRISAKSQEQAVKVGVHVALCCRRRNL